VSDTRPSMRALGVLTAIRKSRLDAAVNAEGVRDRWSGSRRFQRQSPDYTGREVGGAINRLTMASLYTRAADRRRLAIEAMHKLVNDHRTSIPSPLLKVRASAEKDK
jgi:hypothetical protein